jgi:anti-sigma regulatory factor (Ser/Thr protein kinase)/23S rRNA pseudoU1915 N3-methylase RlmH
VPGVRDRGEQIRRFILENVETHPADVVGLTAERFQISTQAVRVHLQRLRSQNLLAEEGTTSDRVYGLRILDDWQKTYPLASGLHEDEILDVDISGVIADLPQNVRSIWSTAFTEIFNNVLDHSAATEASVEIRKTAINTQMVIHDNGVGIFKKIQQARNLPDERYAIMELSKGKFTTDPSKHSGEGIFFTSKMVDQFDILSGGLYFTRKPNSQMDWVSEKFKNGTTVWMKLDNRSTREPKDVYDRFTEDFAFTKTAVPVKLAQVGSSGLVSRSQAKRILVGIDRFKVVSLDFTGVDWIGQSFADEIFRVYQNAHPEMQFQVEGANADVSGMIQRAKGRTI